MTGMRDGGWSSSDKGWALHPSQVDRNREVVGAALAAIDERQSAARDCALCGQRTYALDRFGLCSKVSPAHREWRQQSDVRAGARAPRQGARA